MQESDLHTAIMRSQFELRRNGIDFGSTSSMAFHLGNTMTSCPAVLALPGSEWQKQRLAPSGYLALLGGAFLSWLWGWLYLI